MLQYCIWITFRSPVKYFVAEVVSNAQKDFLPSLCCTNYPVRIHWAWNLKDLAEPFKKQEGSQATLQILDLFILWKKRAEFSLSTVLVIHHDPKISYLHWSFKVVRECRWNKVWEFKIYIAQNSCFLWLLLYSEKQILVTSSCSCNYLVGRIIIFCCIYIVTAGGKHRATGCICPICCKNKT